MVDIIVLAVVLCCVGFAMRYIVKAKKSGVKCIGCPSAGTCSGHCAGGCSCSNEDEKERTLS